MLGFFIGDWFEFGASSVEKLRRGPVQDTHKYIRVALFGIHASQGLAQDLA
ncbi:hypothetical protein NBRC116495_08660 [Aurantivibrio plasticivorans]